MNEQTDAERLRNLLARIHRDGGHYVEQRGIEAACEDADEIVANLYAGECELREQLERAEKTIAGLRASMHLISDRLRKTGPIVDYLNATNASHEVKVAWKDLVYASGIRAGMEAECDPKEYYVPRADLERVEKERDRMRDCLELLDRLGGLGFDKHQRIREALLKEAK